MKKLLIFAAGVVVGAAVGTTLTVLAYNKQKKNDPEQIEEKKPETHNDAVVTSPEELRAYYIQQLLDLGCEVVDAEVEEGYADYFADSPKSSTVNPIEDEEDEEPDEESDIYPVEANPNPYEIVEREFGNKEFYDSERLVWYRGDHVMTDDNYEVIDDWQMHIGEFEGRLNGCRGKVLYFRNEVQQTDYEVTISEESYAHIMGESDEELGNMAD